VLVKQHVWTMRLFRAPKTGITEILFEVEAWEPMPLKFGETAKR